MWGGHPARPVYAILFVEQLTQQMPENVGFRSSTQPTQIYFSGLQQIAL
ncbi:hypothetical protein GXM_05168 [Nostoc sphaeroides CCNUC1]|uniref:Uncharacterized protein n=1 Tax=Nostoc sphaeroides CCNUC1 TaxID=2653204 RepID=A0A5P8W5X3_9NOSO|nr:hypothetical protein GXM_05168 [Nostoc sphaeroides CCNUC1]